MLFADDTSFVVTGKDLNEIVTKANSELKKVCTWFRANKSSLHPEKNIIHGLLVKNMKKNTNSDQVICGL